MKVADTSSIASRIALAFQSASTTTGTDFAYLVKTASRESNFDASAKAKGSSATGLFQFIESTWLETVKTSGEAHGLGEYAKDIIPRSDGSYTVSSAARRREILDLRKDPEIASLMAGELTRKNAAYLERKLGREATDGELYAAHFLGAGGASRLIHLAENDPDRSAAAVFPRQARANRSIFYEGRSARSVAQVLDQLVAQHDSPSGINYATVVASAKPVPTPVAKSQALGAATFGGVGVPSTAGQTVIASRYYRPAQVKELSQALAGLTELGKSQPPIGDTAPIERVVAQADMPETADTAGADDDTTGEGRRADLPVAVAAIASNDAPLPPAAKPERTPAVATEEPAIDAAVAVALAEADAEAVANPVAIAQENVEAQPASTLTAFQPVDDARIPARATRANQDLFAKGSASARISSAWRATEVQAPFQALFRNDQISENERFDDTFVNAFRARPEALQAAVEAHTAARAQPQPEPTQVASAASSSSIAARAPVGGNGDPFDLTGFLKYQIFKEPEDLVPPA
ncbi:hypothetical protein [Breoghania sp.]|uniref:hypothetical protein n=1 Tax=Breoghania sp. TaxID=2065378 RepID=UPI002AAC2700|nr:hypothetical protein [Breoghania sp.]